MRRLSFFMRDARDYCYFIGVNQRFLHRTPVRNAKMPFSPVAGRKGIVKKSAGKFRQLSKPDQQAGLVARA